MKDNVASVLAKLMNKSKELSQESVTTNQKNEIIAIAQNYAERYVHEPSYVSDAVQNLICLDGEGYYDAFAALQKLIDLNKGSTRIRTNCVGISAESSYLTLKKLKVASNLLMMYHGESNKIHAAMVYMYEKKPLVCDITMYYAYCKNFINSNRISLIGDPINLLSCPYELYRTIFKKAYNDDLKDERTVIFDMNINKTSGGLNRLWLSQWSFEDLGIFSRKQSVRAISY